MEFGYVCDLWVISSVCDVVLGIVTLPSLTIVNTMNVIFNSISELSLQVKKFKKDR